MMPYCVVDETGEGSLSMSFSMVVRMSLEESTGKYERSRGFGGGEKRKTLKNAQPYLSNILWGKE